jgi:hypothetical protein
MTKDLLQYDRRVERALKAVARDVLQHVVQHGLPGEHHLFITFRTDHADVQVPESLRQSYPDDMTIVLQHQFWDLSVEEDWFEVTLSFDDNHQKLVIPFAALTAFADPSANFVLQFVPDAAVGEKRDTPAKLGLIVKKPEDAVEEEERKAETGTDNVVALDSFRNESDV